MPAFEVRTAPRCSVMLLSDHRLFLITSHSEAIGAADQIRDFPKTKQEF